MPRKCQVTVVHNPSHPLSKQYTLVEGAAIAAPNPGKMSDGAFQVFDTPNLRKLNAIIGHMTPHHGLIMGAPTSDIDGGPASAAGRLVARALAEQLQGPARSGVITRSQASFEYGDWPAIFPIDLDRCPERIISLGLLAEDLGRLIPELDCELLLRVSGSCLLRGRGVDGFLKGFKAHAYGMVENALQIKDIVRAIKLRLEPHGYVIDTAVNSSEHWMFAGPAVYGRYLIPCEASAWPVAGTAFLDAGRLLASVPPAETYVVRKVGTPSVVLSDSERRRYLAYLQPKIDERRAAVWNAAAGYRQDVLNGAVLAFARYVRTGVLVEEDLHADMQAACMHNGYIRDDGQAAFDRQFTKALDDGWDMPLPDLDASIKASMGQAPELPFGVMTVATPQACDDPMTQWVGRWVAGDRSWPDWVLYETETGQRIFDGSALKAQHKADVRREYKKWKKTQTRVKFANAVENIMEEMNESYAFINDRGGKSFVMWRKEDGNVAFKTVKDFKDMESNRFITIDEETKDYGSVWLKHPRRCTYDGIVFDPNNETGSNYYNLWRGLAIEPIVGDWHLQEWHIRNILAGGNHEYAEFILNCFARKLQYPGKPLEVCLAFRGKPGVGKGVTLRGVKNIFGKHGLHATNPKHLTGDFNAHLETCCFLFADEAYANGDKKIEGIMKGLITEPTLIIEPKGVNPYEAANRLAVMQATNNDWVAPVGVSDRRYAIFDVSDAKMGDWAYFDALYAEMASGGLNAFLAAMLERDVGMWNARSHLPDTAAKREQAEMTLPPLDKWWLGILESGELPGGLIARAQFMTMLEDANKTCGRHFQKNLITAVIKAAGGVREAQRVNGQRFWGFPPLNECRAIWGRLHGRREWSDVTEWESTLSVAPVVVFGAKKLG